MAILTIIKYPDPLLSKLSTKVAKVDSEIARLMDDMAETMYDAPGVGLAATQVDVHEQVIVIDVSEDRSGFMALINPEILEKSDELQTYEEGCLSVPGIYDEVKRAARIRVRALGLDGKPYEFEAEGLLAVCVQHEMDHLKGKVFVEHLSYLKQTRIRAKLRKQERELSRA